MAFWPDIVIESSYLRPILFVECKGGAPATSSQQAIGWRRNLVDYGLDPQVPYFLLAFPTSLFLWRANPDVEAPPDFTVSARDVLKRYMGPIAEQPGGLPKESLEIAFYFWLSDMAHSVRQPEPFSEADQMLVNSGLLDKLKDGLFRKQVPS